jgi:hypothetical protein
VDGELDEVEQLRVGQRGRLAGGSADDEPVRPVVDEVVHQVGGGGLVDAPVGVERRDHRGDDGAELHGPASG